MNSFSLFAFMLCLAVCYSAPADTYTNKFEKLNLDEILASERYVTIYVICVLENKRCTDEGRTLRDLLPEALKTNCAKCTEKQKKGVVKVMNALEEKYPDLHKKVLDKFDPDRKLITAFKKSHPAK